PTTTFRRGMGIDPQLIDSASFFGAQIASKSPNRQNSRLFPVEPRIRSLVRSALASAIEADIAVDARIQQQAETEHDGEHRRAAVGNERQRHADDGYEAHDHCRINRHVEREIGHDPEPEKAPELAAAAEGDRETVADDEHVKRQQRDTADKAEFLGQGGEDEVGLLFRQKAQMALRAVQKALAEQTSGAERDLRLQNVIAGAERIALRVEKRIDPVLLIIAQEVPTCRY